MAKIFPVFIAGIFLSAILAAIIHCGQPAAGYRIRYHGGLAHNKIRKNASEKELMWVSRCGTLWR